MPASTNKITTKPTNAAAAAKDSEDEGEDDQDDIEGSEDGVQDGAQEGVALDEAAVAGGVVPNALKLSAITSAASFIIKSVPSMEPQMLYMVKEQLEITTGQVRTEIVLLHLSYHLTLSYHFTGSYHLTISYDCLDIVCTADRRLR